MGGLPTHALLVQIPLVPFLHVIARLFGPSVSSGLKWELRVGFPAQWPYFCDACTHTDQILHFFSVVTSFSLTLLLNFYYQVSQNKPTCLVSSFIPSPGSHGCPARCLFNPYTLFLKLAFELFALTLFFFSPVARVKNVVFHYCHFPQVSEVPSKDKLLIFFNYPPWKSPS